MVRGDASDRPQDGRNGSRGDARVQRELEWLREEVAAAAPLDDAARIAILEDLWRTAELIRATKSVEQLQREELARQELDGAGMERYRALAARLL